MILVMQVLCGVRADKTSSPMRSLKILETTFCVIVLARAQFSAALVFNKAREKRRLTDAFPPLSHTKQSCLNFMFQSIFFFF